MANYGITKQGPVKITKEDGHRAFAFAPGKKKGSWISKSHLVSPPKSLRLTFRAKFDQKCGCTAVVDMNGTAFESYNVYGSMNKYVASKQDKGLSATPHMRRKFLKEEGFVRARGIKKHNKDVARKLYEYALAGYKVADHSARPTKKAAKAPAMAASAAPAPAPVAAAV